MAQIAKTPEFRASYVTLFEPRVNAQSGKSEYGVAMIFPKDTDISVLKKAAFAAAKEKFGEKAEALVKSSNFKMPFRDGDADRPGDAAYENSIFVNTKSQKKVGVVGRDNSILTSEEQFYSGCYAIAQVAFAAYDHSGSKGVGCYVNAVQKRSDGDSLSGTVDATKVFEADESKEEDGSGYF